MSSGWSAAAVGDEVAELGVLLAADRGVERDGRARGAAQVLDDLGLEAEQLGDLLGARVAAELEAEVALGARDLVDLVDDVDRQAHGAALVGDRAGDRLADPPVA
jgi:hypothetical protein